jgi:hypothetical protein
MEGDREKRIKKKKKLLQRVKVNLNKYFIVKLKHMLDE